MATELTHIGTKRGCDARTPLDWSARIHLRETKLWWVDRHGTKYSKRNGYVPGTYPLYRLDTATVRPLRPTTPAAAESARSET